MTDRSRARPIAKGDIILYRAADGEAEVLGLVGRASEGRIWLSAGIEEIEVAREAISGKVVYRRAVTNEAR